MNRRPTVRQIETALDVLLWLSTTDQDGQVKDNIGEIRTILNDELDERVV